MAKPLHAFDYLAAPDKHPPRPVCVVFGDEPFLKRQALAVIRSAVLEAEDADLSLSTFDGPKVELRDVLEELGTVAMFGGGKRLVVVERADENPQRRGSSKEESNTERAGKNRQQEGGPKKESSFVSRYRKQLEDYVAHPSATGVLVLELRSFPANTNLAKAAVAAGLAIDCNAPAAARVARWLSARAKQTHQVQLPQAAAEMLLEMVGPELGLLDQELAKLALLAAEQRRITPEMVSRSVGGWRAKTAWQMLEAALDGRAAEALGQLDRLLASGEQPIGILAQISASLRRFAAATRLVLQAEAAGRRVQLRGALEQAGIRSFVLKKAEGQLRRLGRQRGSQLYDWLLQADLDLKGASALPPRSILERLIIRLAAPKEAIDGR